MSLLVLPCPLPVLVPEQEYLQPAVPTVLGPVEYRQWKKQLETIDEILHLAGTEQLFQLLSLQQWKKLETVQAAEQKRAVRQMHPGEQAEYQRLCTQVLRCNIARTLLGEPLRKFASRLAESQLLQWFCRIGRIDKVKVPGKSALQRYSVWLPEEQMRQVAASVLKAAAQAKDGRTGQRIGLEEALDLETYFLDSTCVKLHMHFPVDWVLLIDGARTLMKATLVIRRHGLKARMEEPEEFLKRMNRLSMKMTQARRTKNSKAARKAVLREMKKLSKIIQEHAERHLEVLAERWKSTELSQGEVMQIQKRMEGVLEKLPAAIKQAHERIIGERQVKSKEKILSLYEESAVVYVRGKAGAEVEFGRQLLLGESESGVITDWELVLGNVKADTKMLDRSLERLATYSPVMPHRVCADRGFDSKANRESLENRKMYNGICPKAPSELRKKMKDLEFAGLQRRRSQTEARIGIFKNCFLGAPLLSKGYENQAMEVAWSVLTHNLWVIARLPRKKNKVLKKAS